MPLDTKKSPTTLERETEESKKRDREKPTPELIDVKKSPYDPRSDSRFTEDKSLLAKTPEEEIPFAGDNSGNYFENHPGGNPPPAVEPDLTKNPATDVNDRDYDQNLDPLRDANNLRKQYDKLAVIPHGPNQAINFPSQVNTVPAGSVISREERDRKEEEDLSAAKQAAQNAAADIRGERSAVRETTPTRTEKSTVTTEERR